MNSIESIDRLIEEEEARGRHHRQIADDSDINVQFLRKMRARRLEENGAVNTTPVSPAISTNGVANGVGESGEGIRGLSQAEVGVKVLEERGVPLSLKEIFQNFEELGVHVSGATYEKRLANLSSALSRHPRVGRAGHNLRGLIEWPGVTKNARTSTELDSP